MGNPSDPKTLRYALVSRRAILKASLGAGALITTTACGAKDSDVFAGAVAEPEPSTSTSTPPATTTSPAATETPDAAESPDATETPDATSSTPDPSSGAEVVPSGVAVAGEMVVAFTYTRNTGGKLESPYVAVWVENEAGELLETIALFYQQERRGARWLDHLDRWFIGDAERIAAGGPDVAATISSATRPPGDYAVAWDGTVNGEAAPAGVYSIYIESAREDGPVSLTSVTLQLDGSPQEVAIPDDVELSLGSVRINA